MSRSSGSHLQQDGRMFTATVTQAKPLPICPGEARRRGLPVYVTGSLSPDDRRFERTAGEQVVIPYLSHGQLEPAEQRVVVPYLSQGHGVTSAEWASRPPGAGRSAVLAGAGPRDRDDDERRRHQHRHEPVRRDRVRSPALAAGRRHGHRDSAEPEDKAVSGLRRGVPQEGRAAGGPPFVCLARGGQWP